MTSMRFLCFVCAVFFFATKVFSADALTAEAMRLTLLPWIYAKNPSLKQALPSLNDAQLERCAVRVARGLSHAQKYKKIAPEERLRIEKAHTQTLHTLFLEERRALIEAALEEEQRPKPFVVCPQEALRKEREKALRDALDKADCAEKRAALQEKIHNALEKEMMHRVSIAKQFPSLVDFPDERFLYLWQSLKERPSITQKELDHFLKMLTVIEILNRKIEKDARYQAYLTEKKEMETLVHAIAKERRHIATYCQEHQQEKGPRIHEALCSKAALDLLESQCALPLDDDQKEVLRGYVHMLKDFPVWNTSIVESIFSPIASHPPKAFLQKTHTILEGLRKQLASCTEEKSMRPLVLEAVRHYGKKVNTIEQTLLSSLSQEAP